MAEAGARLFVALDLPTAVRTALVAWRAPLLSDVAGTLRGVAPEALHVTLAFLGTVPVEEIPSIADVVVRSAGDVVEPVGGLALGDPVWLPRRRPRALAVALDDRDGRLAALQAAVAGALARDGWLSRQERRFLPHVTVARVRRRGAAHDAAPPPAPPPATFAGTAVTLYRSHLGREAARYEAVARVELR